MKWTFYKNKIGESKEKNEKNNLYFYPNLWGK